MAREYAKVWLRILEDAEFRALSRGPQHLYFVMLLSRTVNNAGVADWRPQRMSVIARGWQPEQIEADVTVLERARFVVVDRQSEEILLRSFIRHDGIMAGPKTSQGMASAYRRTTSLKIRGAIAQEVKRLFSETTEPNTHAWKVPDVQLILAEPEYAASMPGVSDTPRDTPSVEYPDGIAGVSLEYRSSLEPMNLSTSKPKSSRSAPPKLDRPQADPWLFTEFWNNYPRKASKPDARRAWERAVRKKHDPDAIAAAAKLYADDPNRDPAWTKLPATWLNNECWNDGPLPSRTPTAPAPKRSTTDDRVAQNLALVAQIAEEENQIAPRRQIGNR